MSASVLYPPPRFLVDSGKLHGVHVDSTWNPGKMSQKGNFHARMHGILVESILIPGSFHVESRKRFSVIICMEYMESMESVWIPDNITKRKCLCLKSRWTAWIPGNIIQKKKSKKIQQSNSDHECIRIMILCYAKMKSVANILLVNNQ